MNYITFAVLFTSPKCAFFYLFLNHIIDMVIGAVSDLLFMNVICGFNDLFSAMIRINRITEWSGSHNAEKVSRLPANLVLFIIIDDGVFTPTG